MELFHGASEPLNIQGVSSKNGLINIIINKDGIGNFDIALKNKDKKDDSKSKPLALNIKGYEVENFKFKFTNEGTKMKVVLSLIASSLCNAFWQT